MEEWVIKIPLLIKLKAADVNGLLSAKWTPDSKLIQVLCENGTG